MKKQASKLMALFLVFVIAISVMPISAFAKASDFVSVQKRDAYTKNGFFYLPYTIKSVSPTADIKVTAKLVNSSGKVLTYYNGFEMGPGKSMDWDFGYKFSGQPSGKYTLIMHIANWNPSYGELEGYDWTRTITHKAATPSVSFQSYEAYYDKNGRLMHKINITCKNMKGQKLYCKIIDSEGHVMYDWGTDTPVRKTNNETGYFAWSGRWGGDMLQPSGNYTFIISNSANNKVIQKTLWLNIPQGGKG